jgi:apolipoprotein D and lipocalin family protein
MTDRRVDWRRYMGRWSEAASLPQPFEAGCTHVSADYAIMTPRMVATAVEAGLLDPAILVPGGVVVSVRNMCTLADGRVASIEGFAQPVGPGRLRVTFGRDTDASHMYTGERDGAADPGNYRVLEVGAGYEYALVSSGPRAAWVLVRSPDLPFDVIEQLVARLRDVYGYDVSAIRYAARAD